MEFVKVEAQRRFSPHDESRLIFIINANHGVSHYAMIVRYQYGNKYHLCGYLNMSLNLWHNVHASIVNAHCITFQGIGSQLMSIPIELLQTKECEYHEFWIGFDYMDRPQPTLEEMQERFVKLLQAIYADTKMALLE